MMPDHGLPCFCGCEYVHWARDARQIILVNARDHRSRVLLGSDALLWDFLMLGYTTERLCVLFAAVWSTSIPVAAARLSTCLQELTAQGWLVIEPGDGKYDEHYVD